MRNIWSIKLSGIWVVIGLLVFFVIDRIKNLDIDFFGSQKPAEAGQEIDSFADFSNMDMYDQN